MASQTKKRKILRKLKEYNTIWHPDSTLVFKSQKERLVIGRLVDKKLIPLDDEALELCEEWNYKADESLLKQNSENESESDSEKTQSEEEKSNNSEEDTPEESEREEEPVQAITTDTQSDKETAEVDLPTPSMTTTTNLSSNLPLVESFESLKNNLVQTLTSQLSEIESLKSQNSTLQTERDELNEKYTAIMKKFEAMKSLFS